MEFYKIIQFKLTFKCLLFIADDHPVKTAWLHVVLLTEHFILHFWHNVHLLKYYPMKVPQSCFDSFNCSNQTSMQVSAVLFALDKLKKNWFKVFTNGQSKTDIIY